MRENRKEIKRTKKEQKKKNEFPNCKSLVKDTAKKNYLEYYEESFDFWGI